MSEPAEGPIRASDAVEPRDRPPVARDMGTAEGDAALFAHEMRGPLAVVSGYLDLLRRASDERTREYALGAAQRAVSRMDALIDDVLGTLNGTPQPESAFTPVDPVAVVRVLLAAVPVYRSRVSLVNSCTMFVRADQLHLERALANVLDNALKFSPSESTVLVTVTDANEWVHFIVEDEGPGIPPEDAERLRGRFERLDRDMQLPGFGIGLAVTVDLVESMGGEVVLGARSGGSGARVVLALPALPALPTV